MQFSENLAAEHDQRILTPKWLEV